MKTINKYSIFLLAAFLLVPMALRAQLITSFDVSDFDYTTYKATATATAYVTGETQTTTTTVYKPADIIVVLDASSDMKNEFVLTGSNNTNSLDKEKGRTEGYYGYRVAETGGIIGALIGTTYTWYPMRWNGSAWQYKNGNNWTNLTANNPTLGISKMYAAEESASAIVTAVKEDAITKDVDHRISVIKYSDEANSSVVFGFTSANAANESSMKAQISSITVGGAQSGADYGMNLALTTMQGARPESTHVVILLTGVNPEHSDNNNDFSTNVATAAIQTSRTLKQSLANGGCNAKVFAVMLYSVSSSGGIIGSGDEISDNLENFMNYVSSNYPNASAYNAGGTGGGNNGYYVYTTNSNPTINYFESVNENVETSSATVKLDGSSTVVFDVPSPFKVVTNSVTVKAAKLVLIENYYSQANRTYTFDNPNNWITLPGNGPTGGGNVTNNVSEKRDKVTVSGFDFSANYAYRTGSYNNYKYNGYQLIITFDVTLDPNAIGGLDNKVCSSSSGIYYKGNGDSVPLQRCSFTTENLIDLPYIVIKKKGLKAGESALFNVTKAGTSTPINVWITGSGSGDDKTIVKFQEPGKNYTVTQMGWDWAYTTTAPSSLSETKVLGTSSVETAFTFESSPAESTPKHGESVTDRFKFQN